MTFRNFPTPIIIPKKDDKQKFFQRYSAKQERVRISIRLNSKFGNADEFREDVSSQNKIIHDERKREEIKRERDEKIRLRDGSIIRKDIPAEGRYRER